jgi:hypothetical protein
MTALSVGPRLVMQIITTAQLLTRKKIFFKQPRFLFPTNFRRKTRAIQALEDIPRLPPLDVLLDLKLQINLYHETRPVMSVYPAIFWAGLGQGNTL